MSDKKPAKEPVRPKGKGSGESLANLLIVAFAGAMAAKGFVDNYQSFINFEKEQAQQLAALEKNLFILEQEAKSLDLYLTLAEEGAIDISQCEIADILLEASGIVQKDVTQQRELLLQVDYVSVSEDISYRKRQDQMSNQIKTRAGQLKDVCQHLFAKEPIVIPQGYNVPAGWWDKPENSFNYDH